MSSRLLFGLRMAPVAVTLFLVIGFCVPSYVWLEPDIAGERVGASLPAGAGLGATVWAVSLVRGAGGDGAHGTVSWPVAGATPQIRRRSGHRRSSGGGVPRAVMAVAGVLRPRLMVSQTVMDCADAGAKGSGVPARGGASCVARQLKKLLFLLSPDVLPFVSGLSTLGAGLGEIYGVGGRRRCG